jgi:hypothetical protein
MVTNEISKYMSQLGKKGGAVNKKKGSKYFKWVRSHAKNVKSVPEDISVANENTESSKET